MFVSYVRDEKKRDDVSYIRTTDQDKMFPSPSCNCQGEKVYSHPRMRGRREEV